MSHAVDNPYLLARASWLQAVCWYCQDRPEEAKSEALRALDMFEKLGATSDVEIVRGFLQHVDAQGVDSDDECKPLETVLFVVCIDCSRLEEITEPE